MKTVCVRLISAVQDSMDPEFHQFVTDAYGGHIIHGDTVEPVDPEFYRERVCQIASRHLEEDMWRALYVTGSTHPTQMRMDAYHTARVGRDICQEMLRLVLSKPEMDEIELRAIVAGPPEPVVAPAAAPAAPPSPVPDVPVPEPEPEPIEDEEDLEPEDEHPDEDMDGDGEEEPIDDEDPVEDEHADDADNDEPEDDPEEPEFEPEDPVPDPEAIEADIVVDEDAPDEEVVVPEVPVVFQIPAGPIMHIAAMADMAVGWIAQMVAQPADFVIGEAAIAGALDIADGFAAVAVDVANQSIADVMEDDDAEMIEDWDIGVVVGDLVAPVEDDPLEEMDIDPEDEAPPAGSDAGDF